jgi:DNA-directed RNA polymerase specialized sigma24 family protein
MRLRAGEDSDWSLRPTGQLRSEKLYRHIRETIDTLPPELRTMLILCDSEAMSIEDSAEILDLPIAAAKENLQAARLAVRAAIADFFCRNVRDKASAKAGMGINHRRLSEASFTDP